MHVPAVDTAFDAQPDVIPRFVADQALDARFPRILPDGFGDRMPEPCFGGDG
jgi:hypothetical protein